MKGEQQSAGRGRRPREAPGVIWCGRHYRPAPVRVAPFNCRLPRRWRVIAEAEAALSGDAWASPPFLMLDSGVFKGKGPKPANAPEDPGRRPKPLKRLINRKHTHAGCKKQRSERLSFEPAGAPRSAARGTGERLPLTLPPGTEKGRNQDRPSGPRGRRAPAGPAWGRGHDFPATAAGPAPCQCGPTFSAQATGSEDGRVRAEVSL